ncbi:pilus assembly protein PilM, partial [Candidatus Sumerlaeota bacterium]|nr:pilus assembly protein PilM [Candidatus Sumerlaeota bacterium]
PSTDKEELAKMARFEAERHIPFNVERHSISHHILNLDEIKGSEVLIAASDTAVFKDSIDILTYAGLKVNAVDVSTFGLYNYYLFMRSRRRQPPEQPQQTQQQKEQHYSVPLINIGLTTTDIAIIQDDKLLFNRSCTVGITRLLEELSAHLPEQMASDKQLLSQIDIVELEKSLEQILSIHASSESAERTSSANTSPGKGDSELEVVFGGSGSTTSSADGSKVKSLADIVRRWLQRLLGEIRRTYEFARREFDCYPARFIYLAGEGTALKNIQQFLDINFGVKTYIVNPFEEFSVPSEKVKTTTHRPEEFVECLGSAVREEVEGALKINLIPEFYIHRAQEQKRRMSIITLGTMIMAIVVLGVLYASQQFANQRRLLEWYTEKNKELKPIVEELQDKEKKLGIMRKHIQDKRSALAILDTISQFEFIPERVTLTNFKYIKDESLEISGHALSIKDINIYQSALEKTGFFKKVELKQQQSTRLPGRSPSVWMFTLACEMKK